MWWGAAAVALLVLPLLVVHGYATVLLTWLLPRVPLGVRPVLASQRRLHVVNVVQKLAMVLVLVAYATDEGPGISGLGWFAIAVLVVCLGWTIVGSIVHRRILQRLDSDTRHYVETVGAKRIFPWRLRHRLVNHDFGPG